MTTAGPVAAVTVASSAVVGVKGSAVLVAVAGRDGGWLEPWPTVTVAVDWIGTVAATVGTPGTVGVGGGITVVAVGASGVGVQDGTTTRVKVAGAPVTVGETFLDTFVAVAGCGVAVEGCGVADGGTLVGVARGVEVGTLAVAVRVSARAVKVALQAWAGGDDPPRSRSARIRPVKVIQAR